LIILHQPAELLRPAEHGKGVTYMERSSIGGMHFGLVIVPEQDDVEMIVILHISDSLIRKV
jgi:hypothetical protein